MKNKGRFTKPNESIAFKLAASMPPLSHSVPGQEFDIKNSESLQWMIDQPEILQMLHDYFIHSGAIVFQKENKTCAKIIFQEQKNNSRKSKTTIPEIVFMRIKKWKIIIPVFILQITPLAKKPMESSGCGVVQIHSTPPVI